MKLISKQILVFFCHGSLFPEKMENLFTTVMGWKKGTEFQLAAYQAVMAADIGGDTLHHSVGLTPFSQHDAVEDACRRSHQDLSKKVSSWRWLIIDEVSMLHECFFFGRGGSKTA